MGIIALLHLLQHPLNLTGGANYTHSDVINILWDVLCDILKCTRK